MPATKDGGWFLDDSLVAALTKAQLEAPLDDDEPLAEAMTPADWRAEYKKGTPGRLFSRRLIDHTKRARELNEDNSISGDIYFHPTEKHIVVKSIDLGMPNPLCEVNSRPGTDSKEAKKQYWEERWLEAYLIQQAKYNGWKLALCESDYIFLSSQLRFRKRGGKVGVLDLLLYDEDERCLIILELKKDRVLTEAIRELDYYIQEIEHYQRNREFEKTFKCFGVQNIEGVKGYVVWPKSLDGEENKEMLRSLGDYGLIVYDKSKLYKSKPFGANKMEFICKKAARLSGFKDTK